MRRKLFFTGLTIVLLLASGGLMFGLEKWDQHIERETGRSSTVLRILTVGVVFLINRTLLGWVMEKAT